MTADILKTHRYENEAICFCTAHSVGGELHS